MELEEITIKVDSQAARAYKVSSPEEREKMELLFNLWFVEAANNKMTLEEIVHLASEEAKANGLTPEILEDILNDRQ